MVTLRTARAEVGQPAGEFEMTTSNPSWANLAIASRAAIAKLAEEMGAPSVEAAAEGFLAIAVEQMARATDRISTERGSDPRDHVLTAFGGAAGQVACEVAEALGPSQVICPRYGSVLSAWGIGQAQLASLRQVGLGAHLDVAGLERALTAA